MARLSSYVGIDGVVIDPENAFEMFEALNELHGYAVRLNEADPNDHKVSKVLKTLSDAMEQLEELADSNGWYDEI